MNEEIKELGKALLAAKKKFRSAKKSAENSHQKWSYAKIEDIYNAVEDSLHENGLVILHRSERLEDSSELLVTSLWHPESGGMINDQRTIQSEKPGNQARGGAETYCRKYAVLSLCAIATEDDDGESEQEHIRTNQASEFINEKQVALLNFKLKGNEKLSSFIKEKMGISDFSQVKKNVFNSLLKKIEEQNGIVQ